MQPHEINRYLIMSSRLPHSGWAGSGPHVDRRARLADRIIVALCVVGAALFAVGVL